MYPVDFFCTMRSRSLRRLLRSICFVTSWPHNYKNNPGSCNPSITGTESPFREPHLYGMRSCSRADSVGRDLVDLTSLLKKTFAISIESTNERNMLNSDLTYVIIVRQNESSQTSARSYPYNSPITTQQCPPNDCITVISVSNVIFCEVNRYGCSTRSGCHRFDF